MNKYLLLLILFVTSGSLTALAESKEGCVNVVEYPVSAEAPSVTAMQGWSYDTDDLSTYSYTYVDINVSGATKVRVVAYKNTNSADCYLEGVWTADNSAPHLLVDLRGVPDSQGVSSDLFTGSDIVGNTLRLYLYRAQGAIAQASVTYTVAIYR